MTLTLSPIAHSEVGLVRRSNQDSGYVSNSFLLVADGMGGAAAGDLASAMVANDMCHVADQPVKGQEAIAALRTAVEAANTDLADLIARDPVLDGMGTTVCGGIFDGTSLNVVHIGDSRGYILSEGDLTRITHDHSYVQSLIDSGKLDEHRAATHPHRSLLLRVLNGQPDIQPDFFSVDVRVGDRVMFCSDGLCGLVRDESIARAMSAWTLDDAMADLIELAHARGGSDNITIIMADVIEVKPLATPASSETSSDGEDSAPKISTVEQTLELTTEELALQPTPAQGSTYATSGLVGAAASSQLMAVLTELRSTDGPRPSTMEPLARSTSRRTTPGRNLRRDLSHDERLLPALQERQRYTPSSKRSRKGIWLVILLVILALGGAGWGVYSYVNTQYYIGDDDGQVAIYQGLPGNIAGFDTSRLYETTDIALTDLPLSWRNMVTATISVDGGSLEHANATVQELLEKSEQCLKDRAQRPRGAPIPPDGC